MSDNPIGMMNSRKDVTVRSATTDDLVRELASREVTAEYYAELRKKLSEPMPLR